MRFSAARATGNALTSRLDSVLNEERRRAILDLLNQQGRVLVTELSRQFQTSQVTIRKDLEILHAHGLVHRTHGGALPSREGALEDPTLREKEKLHHHEKLRIAECAVGKVKEGQVLILDSGTTTTAIARSLRSTARPSAWRVARVRLRGCASCAGLPGACRGGSRVAARLPEAAPKAGSGREFRGCSAGRWA